MPYKDQEKQLEYMRNWMCKRRKKQKAELEYYKALAELSKEAQHTRFCGVFLEALGLDDIER